MIEADVLVFLKADVTLTTLAGGRIYPKTAPANRTYPYIVYFDSTAPEPDELLRVDRLEYRIHAKTDSQVAQIRNRLKTILDKKAEIRGVIASATFKFFHSEWIGTVPLIEKTDLASPDYIEVLIFEMKFKELV